MPTDIPDHYAVAERIRLAIYSMKGKSKVLSVAEANEVWKAANRYDGGWTGLQTYASVVAKQIVRSFEKRKVYSRYVMDTTRPISPDPYPTIEIGDAMDIVDIQTEPNLATDSRKNKYRGVSYPFLGGPYWLDPIRNILYKLWERLMCPRDYHLFDEVGSVEHYLVCDACQLMLYIAGFEDKYVSVRTQGRRLTRWLKQGLS